jgi:hypothetical protein
MPSSEITRHTGAPEGLEDFEPSDMMVPTWRLDHGEGVVVDSLSGERFEKAEVIITGLVKQRTLWAAEMSETKEMPLCRSLNFTAGVPDQENPKRFPWAAAGFNYDDYKVGGDDATLELPCEGCQLKEWGSHPKNQTPWCAEQWVFSLMTKTGETWSPAILTLQRSNLQAARAYVTSFARSRSPLFVCTTKLTCTLNKRGTVKYTTIAFAKGTDTPEELHDDFADQYRRIREFIQTPRGNDRNSAENDSAAPTAPASNKRGAAAIDDDDEIDF